MDAVRSGDLRLRRLCPSALDLRAIPAVVVGVGELWQRRLCPSALDLRAYRRWSETFVTAVAVENHLALTRLQLIQKKGDGLVKAACQRAFGYGSCSASCICQIIYGCLSGPPCETWSAARHQPLPDGHGPRPFQHPRSPWGLPYLFRFPSAALRGCPIGSLLKSSNGYMAALAANLPACAVMAFLHVCLLWRMPNVWMTLLSDRLQASLGIGRGANGQWLTSAAIRSAKMRLRW